jgi:hypothetical protein
VARQLWLSLPVGKAVPSAWQFLYGAAFLELGQHLEKRAIIIFLQL